MTPQQLERIVKALEGIDTTLKNITEELVYLRAHVGSIEENWEATAHEYGTES